MMHIADKLILITDTLSDIFVTKICYRLKEFIDIFRNPSSEDNTKNGDYQVNEYVLENFLLSK